MVIQGNKAIEAEIEAFERAEGYFFDALKIDDEDKRFAWVERVLRDDQETLREVCLLLMAHHKADNFLLEIPVLKEAIDDMTARCPDLTGRRLGGYEVIRQIARGGMGRIYSAKRVDGEYEQVVAIKVVEVANLEIELFQQERQFLADLKHPNIVTLLDGGTLEEGFPYLVMELVEGIAIDQYVNSFRLTIRETVKLCAELCGVVDDAHQQGIIHCDLKPDNILVINEGSRKGTLTLLDFGIAQSLSVSNKVSTSKLRGITPEYASPQRHQHRSPHNTDDVYSLGVILGQLLSGQGLSLTYKTSLLGQGYPATNINALVRVIDNKELGQILRKATGDKRNSRYQSAKDFQNDLKNWLDDKPINAVQGGLVYFYSKYIYRYRNILFIIITFALLALLIGQMTGEYFQQQEYSDVRQQEAIDAVDDLNILLVSIPMTPTIKKEVTALTVSHLQDWNKAAPDNSTIKKLYADLLVRFANINGHPYYLNLGKTSVAYEHYQKALSLYSELANLEETKLDESIQQSVQVNRSYIQHRLAELEIYQLGYDDYAAIIQIHKKILSVQEQLTYQQIKNLSSKQRRLILSMWLAGAYEGLRVKAYAKTWALLLEAKKMLSEDIVETEGDAKEQRYLTAFYYEITGHLYYLQGNVNAALNAYTKIKRPIKNSEIMSARYHLLLTRVDSAFACLGYLQKNKAMKQQHFKYFEYARANLEALANKYQGVPFLLQQTKKMNEIMNVRTTEGQQIFCADPLKFLLPTLKKNSIFD
ncbi:MAG: serine/threonine protein kinase [Cocleimonas sp.]|nr:serine/threonine protein kinase [Cocleimonas sp.]